MDVATVIVAVLALGVVCAVGFFLARPVIRRKRRLAQHNAALKEFASGLRFDVKEASEAVKVRGKLGRADISISPGVRENLVRIQVSVRGGGMDDDLRALELAPPIRLRMARRRSGAPDPEAAPVVSTGDPVFDGEVEVRGASRALQQALQRSDLRALVRRVVVDMGGTIEKAVVVERPLFSTAAELRSLLSEIVSLARWIDEPNTPAEFHLGAPLVPPFHGASDEKRARAFLELVGPLIGPGEVVEGDHSLDFRGTVRKHLFRIAVENDEARIQLRVSLPIANIELHWDPNMIPEPHRDVWDQETAPIFVGYGVTLSRSYEMGQDPEKIVAQRTMEWTRLPETTQSKIVSAMARGDVFGLVIDPKGLDAQLRRKISEMVSPELQIPPLVQGLSNVASDVTSLPPLTEAGARADTHMPPLHKDRCAYCRTVFVWSKSASCPNCGAPLRA